MKWLLIRTSNTRGPATTGMRAAGVYSPPVFFVAKRKKGNKGKKERASKQKLLKRCYQGQNVAVLAILGYLEFKSFFVGQEMVADNTFQCFVARPFWNPFRRPCMQWAIFCQYSSKGPGARFLAIKAFWKYFYCFLKNGEIFCGVEKDNIKCLHIQEKRVWVRY